MRRLVRDFFHSPWRDSVRSVCLSASAVAFVCWYFGADVWHAIVIGACLGVVRITWIALPDHRPVQWQQNEGPREGGRWDVARLSWSLYGGRGRVGLSALRRVQSIGRSRLAMHQLDLLNPAHAPAIESLVGSVAFAVLSASGTPTPTMRSLVHCLDALDALDPTNAYVGQRVVAQPRLRVMLRRLGHPPVLGLLRRSARRAT